METNDGWHSRGRNRACPDSGQLVPGSGLEAEKNVLYCLTTTKIGRRGKVSTQDRLRGFGVRLIGNKTKLLSDIEGFLGDEGIVGGTFIDIFCGTASVATHFKRKGFRVLANDNLAQCYCKAVAALEVNRVPAFRRWRGDVRSALQSRGFREGLDRVFSDAVRSDAVRSDAVPAGESRQTRFEFDEEPSPEMDTAKNPARRPLHEAIHYLNTCVEPREGLIYRNFCPGGPAGRNYFTDENGRRLDGIIERLSRDYRAKFLTRTEFYLLLSALIDAADRVANISGTYGAYLKSTQPSALRPLTLRPPPIVASSMRHRAYRDDANALVRKLKGDVLYVDPPYNQRQYAANYHILQILAEYHEIDDIKAYEAQLYGKTGLRPYSELKSVYCIRPSRRSRTGNVLEAMTDLILSSDVQHVMISYNEEGLLSKEELGAILARFSGRRAFDFDRQMREVLYRRFRSDANRMGGTGAKRQYRVLEGRRKDELCEWLLFASRTRRRSRGAAGKKRS